MVRRLNLTENNSRMLDELSRQTGKTADDIANAAVEQLGRYYELAARRAAMQQAAGMWKDRDDIPALMQELRKESNRVEPGGGFGA